MKKSIQLLLAGITAGIMVSATKLADAPGSVRYPGMPVCAQGCYDQALVTDGCGFDDINCHCSQHDAWEDTFQTCVVHKCSPGNQKLFAEKLVESCYMTGAEFKPIAGVMIGARNSGVTLLTHATNSTLAVRGFSAPDFPKCSRDCIDDAFKSGACAADDLVCHCNSRTSLLDVFHNCVTKGCGATCQQRFQDSLQATCKSVGVTVEDIPQAPIDHFGAPGSPTCPFDAYPQVPQCAQTCFNATIATDGCCIADAACHCSKHQLFQDNLNKCVVNDCPKRSQQKAYIHALADSCHSVCVSLPSVATLTLGPRPSGSHKPKARMIRRDAPTTAGSSAIVSAILGGLGPIVTNTTTARILASGTLPRFVNQTSTMMTGTASAGTMTLTRTTTGSDVEATATATELSTSESSAMAGGVSANTGLIAQAVMAMVGWMVLVI